MTFDPANIAPLIAHGLVALVSAFFGVLYGRKAKAPEWWK